MDSTTNTVLYKTDQLHQKIEKMLYEFNVNDIIKKYNLHISGSIVLNLLQSKNILNSDLDLYINSHKMSKKALGDMILEFIIQGYYPKNKHFDLMQYFNNLTIDDIDTIECNIDGLDINTKNEEIIKRLNSFDNRLIKNYNLAKYQITSRIVEYILNSYKNNKKLDLQYFSLTEFINCIIRLYNPITKKEIDIIFLKPKINIKKLILNTFDYDIVKNFISFKKDTFIVYYLKKNIKTTKKAIMSINHFDNRISDNFHEFNNFIHRYCKYSKRGFTIFIDNIIIDANWINQLINLVYMNIVIDFKKIQKVSKYNQSRINPPNHSNHVTFYMDVETLYIPLYTNSVDYTDLSVKIILYNSFSYSTQTKVNLKLKISNTRLFCNEYTTNKIFKTKNIKNLILSHLLQNEINNIKNILLNKSNFAELLNKYTLLPVELNIKNGSGIYTPLITDNINSCCVCLDEEVKIFDIHCGNNHKLCRNCLIYMNKNSTSVCPLCRNKMFN